MNKDIVTDKRILVLTGHYGSGKTQIALNIALRLKEADDKVALADLDIVNPYFRTQDSAGMLREKGIRLITSAYAGSNAEVPGMPPETAAIFDDESIRAVVDVGGDDRGTLALGRYAAQLAGVSEIALVINMYRPQTRTVDDVLAIMGEIEKAGSVKITGLINNSNLGRQTTAADILSSADFLSRVKEKTGLPLICTPVREDLVRELKDKLENLLAIKIFNKNIWRIE